MKKKINPIDKIQGNLILPGDKSISHRAVIFSSLMKDDVMISGILDSGDIHSTMRACSSLGVKFEKRESYLRKSGSVLQNRPLAVDLGSIDLGNSGTSIRLLTGLFAGMPDVRVEFFGDASLNKRPMRRVAEPLNLCGADVTVSDKGTPPVRISGKKLNTIQYNSPVSSAQIKSSLMLAALSSQADLVFAEPWLSRDHTERFLHFLDVNLSQEERQVSGWQNLPESWQREGIATYFSYKMSPPYTITSKDIIVPGDISSAAFFMVLATILPNSILHLKRVGLNPSRTGILKALERMGANIAVEMEVSSPEPMGTVRIESGPTRGTVFSGEIIPNIIDEIPILSVLAAFSEGDTRFEGVGELRVKESDRIAAVETNLRSCGIEVESWSDGFVVHGKPGKVRGGKIQSMHDHRIVMSFSVLGLASLEGTEIDDISWIDTSFPNFYQLLESVAQ